MSVGGGSAMGGAAAEPVAVTALLAEDEPLPAAALRRGLTRAGVSLQVLASVGEWRHSGRGFAGAAARSAVLRHQAARPERA